MISIDIWKPIEWLAVLVQGKELAPLLVNDKWVKENADAGSIPNLGRRWFHADAVETQLTSGAFEIVWIRKRHTRRKVTNKSGQIMLVRKV